MQIEIVAAVQLCLYGLAWAVAAALIRPHRAVLAHWAAFGFLEGTAVVLAMSSLATASPPPASALAVSLLSYAVGLRGTDLFAPGEPRLGRLVAGAVVVGGLAFGALALSGLAGTAGGRRLVHVAYSACAAVMWLGGTPSLWRRLRQELPRGTVLVALGPGLGLGLLALVALAMNAFLGGSQAAQVREAVRVPNLIVSLVSSAVFHFGFLFLFMSRLMARMHQLARHDHLTGALNRRAADETLGRLREQHARTGEPLAVLLVDLDHFKEVNDTQGHAAGDRALQLVARTLGEACRPYDAVGRWGGEEFVVLMPATDADAARAAAERFRHRVEAFTREALGRPQTVSIGVAVAPAGPPSPDRGAPTPEALMAEADRALYAAKTAGRNRVCLATDRP